MKQYIRKSLWVIILIPGSILLVILFLSSCGKHKKSDSIIPDPTPITIKVAAYNVEFSKNASATEIGNMLKSYDFDIVCFSEAPGGDWTKNVGLTTGLAYALVGKYSTAGHVDKYKTILSRYPLNDYEEIFMTDTLHTVTKAKIKVKNKELAIYSLHFPFGVGATEKMEDFANYLKNKQNEEISIALGDYNFNISSPDNQLYINAGLVPSWTDLEFDVTNLSTWNALDNTKDKGVIDHIMYNPNKIKAVAGDIIEMEKHLSDHKPVWAILQLK